MNNYEINNNDINQTMNMDPAPVIPAAEEAKINPSPEQLMATLVKDNKKLLITQRITNVAVLVLTIAVIVLTIALSNSVINVSRYLGETKIKVEDFIYKAEISMECIDQLVETANRTIAGSEKGIADALVQINSIDIESLNRSIEDLATIIEPLAKLFRK